jgi:hypothetical protein
MAAGWLRPYANATAQDQLQTEPLATDNANYRATIYLQQGQRTIP